MGPRDDFSRSGTPDAWLNTPRADSRRPARVGAVSATRQVILLIDALGWELAERTGFLGDRLPVRRRLRTILGYSSAAIPSLLTGAVPRDHDHWFLYLRARRPEDSPFPGAAFMARLPRRLREAWKIRRRLAEWWRKRSDIRGYFGLYEVPYAALARLDYVERLDTWAPGTFITGSLVDDLAARGAAAFVSDWRVPDDEKFAAARAAAETPDPPRVFLLYLTEIDARQHAHGSIAPAVDERLVTYRAHIDALLQRLERRGPVRLSVCSDHGMTDVTRVVDPNPTLAATGLNNPRDYELFVDSTFVRFWPGSPAVADRLTQAFTGLDWCHVMTAEEARREGVDFGDDRYGSLIVLAEPGVLIVPSFMGRWPLKGMHGYSPDDPASDAVLLRESDDDPAPRSILDLRRLFGADLDRDKGRP